MECASHMMNAHIAESTHTRNPAIVTRPFSLAEEVGSGHETIPLYISLPHVSGTRALYLYMVNLMLVAPAADLFCIHLTHHSFMLTCIVNYCNY